MMLRVNRGRRRSLYDLAVVAPLWRIFCSDFEGKIAIVKCGPDEKGWYDTIVGNFQVPDEVALNALLPQGKGKVFLFYQHYSSFGNLISRKRKKKTHIPVTIPPLVQGASGTFRPQLRKYEDYVIVSDTLEGLSVPGASSCAGGVATGIKPLVDKKRKDDTTAAGGEKPPKLRKTRAAVLPKYKLAGSVGK
ncbi:hypothetical protein Hanom_Chr02g00144191 [Helianthus anomalus]